jgi:predicted rRNA methylase YqxC with S4 and FtsJ domains
VVAGLLAPYADVLTLIKPHYESAEARSQKGVLSPAQSEVTLWQVMDAIDATGMWRIRGVVQSPIEGQKGNVEYLAWLQQLKTPSLPSTS